MSQFLEGNCSHDKIQEIISLNVKYNIDHDIYLALDHTKDLEQQYKIAIKNISYWNHGGLALWKLQIEKKNISDYLKENILLEGNNLLTANKGPLYSVILFSENIGFLVHGPTPKNPMISRFNLRN